MSSDSAPIKPSEFVLSKVTVAPPRLLDNGSQAAYTNYDGGRLRIQAPTMPLPYPASDYQGNKNYKLSLSFRDRARSALLSAHTERASARERPPAAARRQSRRWCQRV